MYTTNANTTNNGTGNFGTNNTALNGGNGWTPVFTNGTATVAPNFGAGIPDCCGVTGFVGAWGAPANAWINPTYGFGAWNGTNAYNANWNSLFNGGTSPTFGGSYGPYGPTASTTGGFGGTVNGYGPNSTIQGWLTPNGFVPATGYGYRTGYATGANAPYFAGNANFGGWNGANPATFGASGNGAFQYGPTGFGFNPNFVGANFTPVFVPSFTGNSAPTFLGWFNPNYGFQPANGVGTGANGGTTTVNGATTATPATAEYCCAGSTTSASTADCGVNGNIKVRSVA